MYVRKYILSSRWLLTACFSEFWIFTNFSPGLLGLKIRVLPILFHYACTFSPNNLTGNALARVQRVHKPADLWDITFCTRWFEASSTMCTCCFDTQSSPGCTCTRRFKILTHSLICGNLGFFFGETVLIAHTFFSNFLQFCSKIYRRKQISVWKKVEQVQLAKICT